MTVHREPPTASREPVDLSGQPARASAAADGRARISEDDLLRAVGRPLVVCPCACGGEVAAIQNHWDDITEALRMHNGSERHEAWRAWREVA